MWRRFLAGRRRANEKPCDARWSSSALANHGGSTANHKLGRGRLKARLDPAGVQRDADRTDAAGRGRGTYLKVSGVAAFAGDVTCVDDRGRKKSEKDEECAAAFPVCDMSGLHGHSLE